MKAILCAVVMQILGLTVYAQTGIVNGTVVDGAGLPIIGAAVVDMQDKSNGTVTDIDGNFSISVAVGTSLEISYLGFAAAKPIGRCRTMWSVPWPPYARKSATRKLYWA